MAPACSIGRDRQRRIRFALRVALDGQGGRADAATNDGHAGRTLGFEAVGDVDDDDWEDTVEPVLRREIAEGRKLRLLYLLGPHRATSRAMR